MGRWSWHPMGGDGPLDEQSYVDDYFNMGERDDYYEDQWFKDYKEILENATLEDFKKAASKLDSTFILVYTVLNRGSLPKDPESQEFLRSCLYNADGEDFYYNDDTDEEIVLPAYGLLDKFNAGDFGKSIEGLDDGYLATGLYLAHFHRYFYEIFAGEMGELAEAKGLLQTIFEGEANKEAANKVNELNK